MLLLLLASGRRNSCDGRGASLLVFCPFLVRIRVHSCSNCFLCWVFQYKFGKWYAVACVQCKPKIIIKREVLYRVSTLYFFFFFFFFFDPVEIPSDTAVKLVMWCSLLGLSFSTFFLYVCVPLKSSFLFRLCVVCWCLVVECAVRVSLSTCLFVLGIC